MASVLARKLASGAIVWRVEFRVDGAMKQETFDDPDAAHDFGKLVDRIGGAAARIQRDLRSKHATPDLTLADWTTFYLNPANAMLNKVSARTPGDYLRIANRSFLVYMGNRPIADIDEDAVKGWVQWQQLEKTQRTGRAIAAKTVRNYHGLLSQVLAAAVRKGHLTENWAYGTELADGDPREPVFLSQRQFGVILRFIPEYYRPLTVFLAMTGTRWGEATAIQWGDFSFDDDPIRVRISRAWKKGDDGVMRVGKPKTPRSRRTIPVDANTVDLLGEPGPGDQRIFVGKLGADRIWYGRYRESIFEKAVDAACDVVQCAAVGVKPISKRPKIHDLRHTHASWLISKGESLFEVQRRLGHENIATTMSIYAHLDPDAAAKTANIVGGLFDAVMEESGISKHEKQPT
jgi:integrase